VPLPGHYQGTTSQGYAFGFDVAADVANVTNIVTGPVDETCTPSRTFTWLGLDAGSAGFPISVGVFQLNGGSRVVDRGISSSSKISIVGQLDGSQAQGTYRVTSTFTDQGTAYSCDNGSVTWTATHS
jgi:hypothetical protein